MFRINLKVSKTKSRRHPGSLLPVEGNSDLNQAGNSERCEKSLHSRPVLKRKPTRVAHCLDMRNERREVKEGMHIFYLKY